MATSRVQQLTADPQYITNVVQEIDATSLRHAGVTDFRVLVSALGLESETRQLL